MEIKRYVFAGVVHPERAWIELSQPVGMDLSPDTVGFAGNLTVAIYKNQIIATLTTTNPFFDMVPIRFLVRDFVQGVVDGVGLEAVVAYSVDIRSVTDGEGLNQVFGVDVPGITLPENTSLDTSAHFELSGRDAFYRHAAADFRMAILNPTDTSFYCRRALESIVESVMQREGLSDKGKGWKALGDALRIDNDALVYIGDLAGDVRHGELVPITIDTRNWVITTTRAAIRRYVERETGSSNPESWEVLGKRDIGATVIHRRQGAISDRLKSPARQASPPTAPDGP